MMTLAAKSCSGLHHWVGSSAAPLYRRSMLQREFPATPLAGVGAVIVDHGRVLLVRRGNEPAKGRWSIPGGLIELGETLHQAVMREVHEETGLLVEPMGLVELLDRIYREDNLVRYHYVIADYLCRVTGGTLAAASDADDVRWVERSAWWGDNAIVVDPDTVRVLEAGWRQAAALENRQQGEGK